jgi:hypothetical protein
MHGFFAALDANEAMENQETAEEDYEGDVEYGDENEGDAGYEGDEILIDLDGTGDSDESDDELIYLNEAFDVGKYAPMSKSRNTAVA